MNNERQKTVPAQEQLFSSARVGAFITKLQGDLIVSERSGKSLGMTPIHPQDSEFQREYPSREVGPITHRRMLLLVKHAESSKMTDYLVVRDETQSAVPQQLNIHLLARDTKIDGRRVDAVGQLGVDMSLFVAEGAGENSEEPKIEARSWFYADEYMFGPEYALKAGETMEAWDRRIGDQTLPPQGFKPVYKNAAKGETAEWLKQIKATEGLALIPPKNWKGPWQYGEYQKWLRIESKPGTPLFWVLYPYKRGDAKPILERVDDKTVKIVHAGETEFVSMDSVGGVTVRNSTGEHQIMASAKLPPLGQIKSSADSIYRGE